MQLSTLGITAALLTMMQTGALAATLSYPPAPTSAQSDVYHGTTVADPFRPLEELDAPATRAWVDAEVALTNSYLSALPARDAYKKRLTSIVNYEKRGAPTRYGDRYIYSVNSGLQNQSVIFQTKSLDAPGTVLIDPNTLSSDGTVALGWLSPTQDGSLVAYSIAASGSDWSEWHVRRTADATDLPDVIKWSKFSIASWTRDNRGFYYARYAEPNAATQFKDANTFQKIYYHVLGTPQSADRLVYERPDEPRLFFSVGETLDGTYLVLSESKGGSKNAVLVKNLRDPAASFVKIFDADASYSDLYNVGSRFYFLTDKDAPRGRVISLDVSVPTSISTIVPQADDALQSASVIGGKLFLDYTRDARSVIRVASLGGNIERTLDLPGFGTAGIGGWPDRDEAFYTFTSYTTPASIYRYDVAKNTSTLFFTPKIAFDQNAYTTEQVFVTSKDGTRVPMFLTYKKGLARNGSAPTILYGYGGFNISLNPAFSTFRLPWLEDGGIYAVVNLRGGSEYGEDWHQAGMLSRKQNVFDDYIAAAHYLIDNKYTSTPKLAAQGGSNGGLLVGAAITQHPELFGAAIPQVGVMDMLRFHKFTIGAAWVPEYGSADDAAQFPTLYAYSPLHNLRRGTVYPPTMIMTADHDDRVYPAHSFKFAATMQADQGGPAPVLIRIETKAGHGAGTPLTKSIEEFADIYAFLGYNLGVQR